MSRLFAISAVFRAPSGQVNPDGTRIETSGHDGTVTQVSPDGDKTITYSDGSSEHVFTDGTIINVAADGSKVRRGLGLGLGLGFQVRRGRPWPFMRTNGAWQGLIFPGTRARRGGARDMQSIHCCHKVQLDPDKTRMETHADGSRSQYNPDGVVIETSAAGEVRGERASAVRRLRM